MDNKNNCEVQPKWNVAWEENTNAKYKYVKVLLQFE